MEFHICMYNVCYTYCIIHNVYSYMYFMYGISYSNACITLVCGKASHKQKNTPDLIITRSGSHDHDKTCHIMRKGLTITRKDEDFE